jgi:hypothetical protein
MSKKEKVTQKLTEEEKQFEACKPLIKLLSDTYYPNNTIDFTITVCHGNLQVFEGIYSTSFLKELTTELKELALEASKVLKSDDFNPPSPTLVIRGADGGKVVSIPQAFLIEFAKLIQQDNE